MTDNSKEIEEYKTVVDQLSGNEIFSAPVKRGRGRPRKINTDAEVIKEPKKPGRKPMDPKDRKSRKARNSPNPSGRPKKYSKGVPKDGRGSYDMKTYYVQNKDYLSERIKCECGQSCRRDYFNRHKKSGIHFKNMEVEKIT